MGTTGSSKASASQLDLAFDGTWVIVPSVDGTGKIIGVSIYSPACGHPQGVTFSGGLNPNPWPDQTSFYELDNHSHTLNIQRSNGAKAGMAVSGIDQTVNHCVNSPRPIGSNWDLLVSINAGPDSWTSSDTVDPHTTDSAGKTVPCFSGKDVPAGKVSSLQTLSFVGVTGVQLLGAPANVQALLPSPWNNVQGTLIFQDEIPYIPTLQHERAAISAMANLAGLDLALDYPLPKRPPAAAASGPARPMLKATGACGMATIVLPS
jgi:hypothetical protein